MESGGLGRETGQRDAWPDVLNLLYQQFRRSLPLIFILIAIFACLAVFARISMPQTYRATAELLIDPRGLQVFQNDLVTGQYDANAAVNYVESQIHVILSSQVLSKALLYARDGVDESPTSSGNSPQQSGEPVSARAIEALRRNVSVYRAERSYILSVTARASDPAEAARLANAVVRAYLDEDTASRAAVANRLTEELGSRLAQLRQRLAEAEVRAEDYRRRNNLVSTDNKLIVDQQLAAAVVALDQADERLAAIGSRHQQLLSADPSIVASLSGGGDQTRLNTLIGRQIAAREEYTRLSMRLGDRHPSLVTARSQMNEVNGQIQGELERIRASSAAAVRVAEQERASLAENVDRLTALSANARESSIELRTLEEQARIDRELLSSVETRSREMAEFAVVDSTNVRLLSTAYPPEVGRGITGMIVWGIAGAILGAMIGLAYVVLRVLIRLLPRIDTVEEASAHVSPTAPVETFPEPEPKRPIRRHGLLSLDADSGAYRAQRLRLD